VELKDALKVKKIKIRDKLLFYMGKYDIIIYYNGIVVFREER
jgi:hypothetical protein